MNHWLVKTEPDKYGWHHFTQQGRAVWDGVRNYQARNNLNAMRLGDAVLYYHSVSNPGRSESPVRRSDTPAGAVVGLATVVKEAYPDPTSSDNSGVTVRWVVVELEPVMALEKPVLLAQIRAEPLLATIGLIRQSRLSVMPIRPDAFELILKMGQAPQPQRGRQILIRSRWALVAFNMNLITPAPWSEYELIDSGNFQKLERFGDYVLARPEPQAIWDKSLPDPEWEKRAHAFFRRDRQSPERGDWQIKPDMRDPWYVQFRQAGLNLTFKLALTTFKHVGLFPEQADNWTFIYDKIRILSANGARPKVLNLFAYTGGASLAARQAGADVTHVDAVKPVISWARENMDYSHLNNIRWVVEDAVKFVRREVRRGNRYNGLILDPPAYGRGPDGEKWVLEEQLNELLKSCADLLDGTDFFFILNLYSLGFSSLIVDNLISQIFGAVPNPEWGELYVADPFRKRLPLGVFYRFASA